MDLFNFFLFFTFFFTLFTLLKVFRIFNPLELLMLFQIFYFFKAQFKEKIIFFIFWFLLFYFLVILTYKIINLNPENQFAHIILLIIFPLVIYSNFTIFHDFLYIHWFHLENFQVTYLYHKINHYPLLFWIHYRFLPCFNLYFYFLINLLKFRLKF